MADIFPRLTTQVVPGTDGQWISGATHDVTSPGCLQATPNNPPGSGPAWPSTSAPTLVDGTATSMYHGTIIHGGSSGAPATYHFWFQLKAVDWVQLTMLRYFGEGAADTAGPHAVYGSDVPMPEIPADHDYDAGLLPTPESEGWAEIPGSWINEVGSWGYTGTSNRWTFTPSTVPTGYHYFILEWHKGPYTGVGALGEHTVYEIFGEGNLPPTLPPPAVTPLFPVIKGSARVRS